ncbi:MAG: universal stress protein [Candidatus Nitrosopolaris sp.]
MVAIDDSDPSLKTAYRAITILTNKKEDNAELIVLHVIYSEIKHVNSTYSFGGPLSQFDRGNH